MTKPVAVIVGAGIAGLAAAWWLDTAGWESMVVEKSNTFRDGGYIVSVAGAGYETIKHMGILDDIKAVAQDLEGNHLIDNRGKKIRSVRYADYRTQWNSVSVRRDDLATVLAKSLPKTSSIRFGTTVDAFTDEGDKVSVVLADGHIIQADLLIGADGFHSRMRSELFKEDADCLDRMGYYYAAYTYDDHVGEKGWCHSYTHAGQMDMMFPLRDQGMTAMHLWHEDRDLDLSTSENRVQILKDITSKCPPAVRAAVDQAAKSDVKINMDALALVKLPRWSKGRVLLMGDAAHCLTLISGQGAGTALTSAGILSRALQSTSNVLDALRIHEAKLRPSIERLQQRSKDMAGWYIPKNTLAYWIRNWMFKLIPYSWLVSYHVKSLKTEVDLIELSQEPD
ncbi:hypothetical protein PV08_01669 [Exophiala spinifera]|uniref:FAD-binding domain-containing protein n=1 Tax=Exophiala spinifera TaxID=91928 RepID=A0A0D2BRR4_9EURO|nr:uncharacterized protein PV08_01669 [Exophiala spinifera]KIW21090.1 hypothetical protein PV08_01669 [Exophiala spinifera]